MRCVLLSILAILLAQPLNAAEISISAASSLKDVINDLSGSFVQRSPGVTFVKNYGASGALAKQIESGAPADIFISASPQWLDYLRNRNRIDTSSIGTFAYNTLVFAGVTGKASSLRDVVKMERVAIGSPKSVPAGEYAMEALTRAGLDKPLAKKLVGAKDVRECLMYAERGEVDGAFVYRSDALQAKQAKILFVVPQELYSRVSYPMALTVTGKSNKTAVSFLAYLRGKQAKAVLEKYGFVAAW